MSLARFVFVVLAAAPDARANGRFPRADQLVLAPERPDELWLRTTFGLLVSSDAGQHWDWVCERAIGFSGIEDPALALLPGGVVLAGLQEGLAQSEDRGCHWHFAAAADTASPVVDLSARRLAPNLALALSWERQAAGSVTPGYRARFLASEDNALTWQPRGAGIDPAVLVLTLDVAPSDPRRVYASGIRSAGERSAALFVSVDAGQSWVEHPAPLDARREEGVFIAAVDPTLPELVYLRTSGASFSRLLVTRDGGLHFEERHAGEPMLGFALSPDGARVWLGGANDGLWTAERDMLAFERISPLPILCLSAGVEALYACSNDRGGFAVGASPDGGQSFEPLLRLRDVRGPLACGAGGAGELCEEDWPALRERLGIVPRLEVASATPTATSERMAAGCALEPVPCRTARISGFALSLLGVILVRRRLRARLA